MYVCVFIYMCEYLFFLFIYMYMYICIHTHKHLLGLWIIPAVVTMINISCIDLFVYPVSTHICIDMRIFTLKKTVQWQTLHRHHVKDLTDVEFIEIQHMNILPIYDINLYIYIYMYLAHIYIYIYVAYM